MERYSEFKDSGVKWLGKIPSHWELIKSKYLWKEQFATSENGFEQLLSVSQYDGITLAKGDSRSESLKGYKIVSKDDLVINIMLAWMGGLGVSNHDGIVSPAYCIYRLTGNSNPKYLHYLYKTPLYLAEFARHSTGVIPSRWRMYTDDFGQVLSLIPPRKEQDAIVSYLDERMGKIDTAIAQQQKMIDLLNERKQIIINKAVTKGLDPKVKMKPSGIDWIGEIPEHWKVIRIKYLLEEMKDRSVNGREEPLSMSQVFGLIPTRKMDTIPNMASSYVGAKLVKSGNLVFNKLKAHLGVFNVSKYDGLVSPDYAVYASTGRANLSFLEYIFKTPKCIHEFVKLITGVGAGLSRLYTSDLFSIYCAIPPINEQNQICSYIESNTVCLNEAIINCRSKITLLQERKQIIINDVVTGKIKVV